MHEKKHNYVYKITNLLNNKIYIGVHSTDDLNDGYMGSGTAITNAIKKYGVENFKKEILVDFDTAEVAYRMEKMLVDEKFVKRKDTYNAIVGGIVGKNIMETRRKLSLAGKGRRFTEEHRRKMSEAQKGEKNHMFGKHPSEETRKKMSEARSGEKNHMFGKHHSEETRKKLSEATKGKHLSEETRKKMSEAHKGKRLSEEHRKKISKSRKGEKHPMFGKHHTDESRKKISESLSGEKNHNYGKHITQGRERDANGRFVKGGKKGTRD